MKAISKQHGKSKWIDTKLSRHYVVEIAQAYSKMLLQSQFAVITGEVMHRRITSTQGTNVEDKNIAVSENILSITNAVSEISKSYQDEIKSIQNKWGSNDKV